MTIYGRDQIKEEVQGESGLAVCRDNSGGIYTFLGGLVVPLSKRYEAFRISGLEIVAAYDGIKPELAIELAKEVKELYEGKVKISDLDKILLKDAVEK